MHNYIVNASIQILPIAQDKHPYEWVDEAILVIQQSGIKYKIGPFATVVEGTYEELVKIVLVLMNIFFNKNVMSGLRVYSLT